MKGCGGTTLFNSNPTKQNHEQLMVYLFTECQRGVWPTFNTEINKVLTHQILHQRLVLPPCHTEKKS